MIRIVIVCFIGSQLATTYAGQEAPVGCRGMAFCGIVDARLICGPAPVAPRLAKIARITSIVMLAAVVDARGKVQSLHLISGHPFLVEAAIDTAKRYLFQPATARGVPLVSIQSLHVNFGARNVKEWTSARHRRPAPSATDSCPLTRRRSS